MSLADIYAKDVFELQIYTDGACHPNPGVGGWGAVIVNPDTGQTLEMSGADPSRTTNNRMEMLAVVEPLEFLLRRRGPMCICIHTDSKYVFNGATMYVHNWKKKRWRLSNGDPVKNEDLWRRIEQMRADHTVVRFNWIRGHNGTKHNERADTLAVAARKALAQAESHC